VIVGYRRDNPQFLSLGCVAVHERAPAARVLCQDIQRQYLSNDFKGEGRKD
jgi:hypothetical protein